MPYILDPELDGAQRPEAPRGPENRPRMSWFWLAVIGINVSLMAFSVHRSYRSQAAHRAILRALLRGRSLNDDHLDKIRPSWSPDGKRLAFAGHDSGGAHIWLYIMDAGHPESAHRLTDRKTPDYQGVFSPDGRRLLLTIVNQSGTQGNLDIALIDADGRNLRTVAGDINGKLSHQEWPSWSTDGRRFAFSSTHDGNSEIYAADLDGSHVDRLTQSPGLDVHPCWSPDGKAIAFATDRWGGLELAAVGPDGKGLVRLTESRGLDDYPAYSPDGRRLAFVSHRDGQFEVYTCNADGSDPVNRSRHPGRDTFPTWTPDGKCLTFVSDRGGGADLIDLPIDP